jgi:hypothetical protein
MPSSQPPYAAVNTGIMKPQLDLHLPHRNGDDHYRFTGTGFESDASKEGRDATGA